MKLAEALNLRADTQKSIQSLKERLLLNAKVQENEAPSEDPETLLIRLNHQLNDLEHLIQCINRTNSLTMFEGESLADMIAKRDTLGLHLSILRSFVQKAADKIDRYSNNEIRIVSTINVAEKQREIDQLAKAYRLLDTKLQGLNWTTDLLD